MFTCLNVCRYNISQLTNLWLMMLYIFCELPQGVSVPSASPVSATLRKPKPKPGPRWAPWAIPQTAFLFRSLITPGRFVSPAGGPSGLVGSGRFFEILGFKLFSFWCLKISLTNTDLNLENKQFHMFEPFCLLEVSCFRLISDKSSTKGLNICISLGIFRWISFPFLTITHQLPWFLTINSPHIFLLLVFTTFFCW